jgi:autophagy-related protein 9
MREENYLVALFNKEILDLRVPFPHALERILGPKLAGGQLTRALEWNVRFCLLGFLFGKDGQVRRAFVSERNRAELIEGCIRGRFFRCQGCGHALTGYDSG